MGCSIGFTSVAKAVPRLALFKDWQHSPGTFSLHCSVCLLCCDIGGRENRARKCVCPIISGTEQSMYFIGCLYVDLQAKNKYTKPFLCSVIYS